MAWEVIHVTVGSTINFIFPLLYPNTKLGFSSFPILLHLVLTWKCRCLKLDGVSDGAPLPLVCNCEQLAVVQTRSRGLILFMNMIDLYLCFSLRNSVGVRVAATSFNGVQMTLMTETLLLADRGGRLTTTFLDMSLDIYVSRDERFGHLKLSNFLANALKSIAQVVKPKLELLFGNTPEDFDSFEDVFKLYEDGIKVPESILKNIRDKIPVEMLKEILQADGERSLKFPIPK